MTSLVCSMGLNALLGKKVLIFTINTESVLHAPCLVLMEASTLAVEDWPTVFTEYIKIFRRFASSFT
jgi:hypothetical protein